MIIFKNPVSLVLVLLLLSGQLGLAQHNSRIESFKGLSYPEKYWVLAHPFIAGKTYYITKEAKKMAAQVAEYNSIDKDSNGGQMDAFRHAVWMALLVQKIAPKKAQKLGKAHEKGNYRDFKKNLVEEGAVPDKISSEMDLWNNMAGILIGKQNREASKDSLKHLVIEAVNAGKMRIIKKDKNGNFLDEDSRIISAESLTGKWENNKCLVPSDYKP